MNGKKTTTGRQAGRQETEKMTRRRMEDFVSSSEKERNHCFDSKPCSFLAKQENVVVVILHVYVQFCFAMCIQQ